jgi:serine/threonine protein kinase
MDNRHALPEDQSQRTERKEPQKATKLTTYKTKFPLKRTASSIFIHNKADNSFTTFHPTKNLGSGTYAKVRKFSSRSKSFAVKKPRKKQTLCQNLNEVKQLKSNARHEFNFMKKAYPDDGPYDLIHINDKNPDTTSEFPYIYSYRILMPLVEGCNLKQLTRKYIEQDILANIFLNTALEVDRLHAKGIIHGDLSIKNIIIDDEDKARLIDFSFAYEAHHKATTVDIKMTICNDLKKLTYFAPERVNVKSCDANPAQDIYSLAYVFELVINRTYTLIESLEFFAKYPCIQEFIHRGLSVFPSERLPLSSITEKLAVTSFMPNLKQALFTGNLLEISTLLNSKQNPCTENDMYQLIFSLCKSKDHVQAEIIIDYLFTKKPKPASIAILDLFKYIADQCKKIPQLTHSLYNSKNRGAIITSLLSALKLADMVLNHPDNTVDAKLLNDIYSSSALADIYQNLCSHKLLVTSLDKEVITMFRQ